MIPLSHHQYLRFHPSEECVSKILPYSIDGLPVVPKPWGREVDAKFEPSETQQNEFVSKGEKLNWNKIEYLKTPNVRLNQSAIFVN